MTVNQTELRESAPPIDEVLKIHSGVYGWAVWASELPIDLLEERIDAAKQIRPQQDAYRIEAAVAFLALTGNGNYDDFRHVADLFALTKRQRKRFARIQDIETGPVGN